MVTNVYILVIGTTTASINLAYNFSLLTIRIFFSLINLALSASNLFLTASILSLSFANYAFAIVNLRISSLNASLLKVSISFDEVNTLPLPEINIPLLSTVAK